MQPNEDDPVDHAGSIRSQDGQNSGCVTALSIQVRSRFPTITQTNDPSQPLTRVFVIELPGKRPSGSASVPRVAKTSPVVKSLTFDFRVPSASSSSRPGLPPQYDNANGMQRSRSAQGLSTRTRAQLFRVISGQMATHSEESPLHAITEYPLCARC